MAWLISCVMIKVASGAVRRWDAFWESVVGLVRPIPPSLTGRLSRSHSCCEHGGLPVNVGMNGLYLRVGLGGPVCLG